MTDRALVIGLDYDNADWELRCAVRDALAFADWVTADGAGRATKETLTLLLAPHPDRPVTDRKFELATGDAIKRALIRHKKLDPATNRFWFFYAGHGLAPAGGGPDEAPIVVPAGLKTAEDLEVCRAYPIDLGSWIREMQVCAPSAQFYFVDACRGIVVSEDAVTATKSLFFDLSKVKPGGQAQQAVLFATTAGQLANEQGLHGLFSGALIDGLKGQGVELEPDPDTEDFVLTFSGLLAYTKRRIQVRAEQARRLHKTLPTQEPAESLFLTDGTIELARFKEMPSSSVRVFVIPEEAAENGTAGIRSFNTWKKKWERQEERPKPLGVPVEWNLPATSHKIEIEAEGYENWSRKVHVIEPMEFRAELVKKPQLVTPESEGLESLGPESVTLPPDGAELAPGQMAMLRVRALDRYARIEVFDQAGKRVAAAWQQLDEQLPVGAYKVEISLPTETPIVHSVLLTADEDERIDVRPDPQLTARLPHSAGMVQPQDGFTVPSEAFGFATTTHLGSLLAWAAWAAQYPPHGHGQKLRHVGIEPLPPGAANCFVRVLVGDARAPGHNPQGGPLETLILEIPGQAIGMKPVPALIGFAEQGTAPLNHHASLTVQTGGLNPKRFPLPYIANHVWTIVIVRESSQRTEIHRYLQPLQPQGGFDDTIRLVERNWRALETRRPLHEHEAKQLLQRQLDPLSLAVLGYRLAREQRFGELAPLAKTIADAGLADGHVLAALVDNRDVNMQHAVASAVPVVGEGYRLMQEWLIDSFAKQNMPPPVAPEPFTGGLWTTFDTRGEPVISKAFPAHGAPAWAKPLLPAAEATARIEQHAGPTSYIGTGFLIGPRALATVDFIASSPGLRAQFGAQSALVESVVATTNDDRHAALTRIEVLAHPPTPLKIRWDLPEVGQRIAVIGHPTINFAATLVTLAAFTTPPAGEKMIMPGVITAVEPNMLTYECWTMAGVAGGPIVDLATGEVIGIHHSGKYEGGPKKLGFGVPVSAIEALLKTPT